MKILRNILFAALLFFPALCLAEELELSLAVDRGLTYATSYGKTITVQMEPMSFSVTLKNPSSSAQSIYWESASGPEKFISFEMTDESGRVFTVKRKKSPSRSAAVVSSFLAGGANVSGPVTMDPAEWENLPLIEPGKVKKYRTRALYDNGGHTIYSDYYTLILDGG